MALEYDISGLLGKTENEGTTAQGRLSASEFNKLVGAVSEVQTKVEGTIKGIKYNGGAEGGGQTFKSVDKDGYLLMTINNPDGTLSIELDTPDPYIARDAECPITVRVSSKDSAGASTAAACIVNFYLNGSQVPFYTGNVYDKETTIVGAAKELTIDLSKIVGLPLLTGELDNEIRVEINNRYGITKSAYCYVKIVDLSLTVDIFDTNKVFTENNKPQLIARVSGTDAYVTAIVDGKEILTKGLAYNGANTNFGATIFDNCNTHGVHTIEVYASITRATADGEITITTTPISYKYIYGTDNAKPVVMLNVTNYTPEEYSNFDISYIAYKYSPTASSVSDIVNVALCDIHYVDGVPVVDNEYIKLSQSVTFDATTNSASGKAVFSLFPVNNVSLIGKKSVVISIGDFIQVEEIEVKKSSVTLSQLAGHAVYLTANNRSNSESSDTIRTWRSNGINADGSQLVVDVQFDDNIEFIDTGSGWIVDDEDSDPTTPGNMAMHLRKGRFFTLNYAPFADNPTYGSSGVYGTGRGKTISIEFATRNCLNQNSKVIECLDSSNGQERGFVITASKATLKANTFNLSANFKEDTRVKVDFVIEGKQIKYDYDTVIGENGEVKKGSSDEALAIIYVDGVYQCLEVIPTSTSFLQGNMSTAAPFIRFGSNDCDLDVYNIRIYDQALTPIQIVNNYSYDTPNFTDKINIAKRNNIFDDKINNDTNKPNINIEKLRIARPELPFFYVKQPLKDGKDQILPQDKSSWLSVPFTEWKNPANENDKGEAAISWTATGGRWRNQGTSSMTYPWPWRNWDWQLKEGEFAFGDGTTGGKWSQYKGMSDAGSIKKITLKKDYASSEMCNNAITSEYFTDMALAIGDNYPNVLSPAQRLAGATATPYRLTFVATPCFLFQKFNDGTKVGTAGAGYEALGMMNLIPNKNECDHLGFSDKSGFTWDNCRAQSWELRDNKDDWFWYKKLDGIIRNDDGTYVNDLAETYEARYPKDSTLNKTYWDILDGGKREESDFGMVVKDKPTISAEQRAALYEEQRDIIDFHNWLVDCNRQIPEDYKAEHGEYRKFSASEYEKYVAWEWNKLENGRYNEYDTPEYRLKKFTAEAPTRLIIDQFCMYYIWRETFHAFDSGFKNLQVYTMGKATNETPYMQWGCMVRDADTTLGIENTGKDIFPAHLEDTDYYTKENDTIEFVYDGAKDMYHSKSIGAIGGHPVLNGQLGSLWINLRDVYGARISEIYRALAKASKSNWTGTRAIKRFRDHQEKWCESLYNFGMRQYFGGSPFTQWITSGLGDKKNSRASWLERGFYYRNSKYKNLSDCCTVRAICYETPDEVPAHNIEGVAAGYTANVPFKFKSYIPMYIGLGADAQEMTACTNFMRITDVSNTYDVTPGPDGLNFATSETGDQNNWFFGTSQLTEIGDFARGCKIKVFQQAYLPKLRELNLGHEKNRDNIEYREYYNEVQPDGTTIKKIRPFTNQYLESIECSSMKQLTLLDITNHTVLKDVKALNECTQLQKLYARGTDAITSLDLPKSTSLETIYLGKNLVSLDLTDLTSIKEFELEGANSIGILYIRNCGSYMAKRSYDIMTMSIASLENSFASSNGNICELIGINWDNSCNVDASYLERLLNINATLSGYIYVKNMSNDLKVRLIAAYGNIDDRNNGLYIEYIQEEITSAKLPSKMYFHIPGKYQLKFTVTPSYSNTYSSAEWKISSNAFAGFANDIDAANGVLTRYEGEADKQSFAKLTVTIKQLPYSNGDPRENIVLESIIYFYERLAKPGDIVFHDGSYSDELDNEKTPIGVCFYIDPNDNTRRLMCALEPIFNGGNITWGVTKGFTYTTSAGTTYLGASEYLSVPGLSTGSLEEGNLVNDNCYNISAIKDVTDYGLGISSTIENIYVDAVYRDATNAKNDYFKTAAEKGTIYTELGWKSADSTIRVDGLQLLDGGNTIVINKNDRIPIGYYNTLAIMQQRNKLLDAYKDCDNQIDVFHRPAATEDYSELSVLNDYANRAKTWSYAQRTNAEVGGSGTRGELLYYHAASACFAYEPSGVNNLADKFKKYNWFLPASGDLTRLLYYVYQSYDTTTGTASETPINSEYNGTIGEPANAFKNAISNKIPNTNISIFRAGSFSNNTFYSSTEAGRDQVITINATNGKSSQTYKYNTYKVVPICVF